METKDNVASRRRRARFCSATVFSSTLNVASTLFTVFGDLSGKCNFSCWSFAFVIPSSFWLPKNGIKWIRRIDSFDVMPLGGLAQYEDGSLSLGFYMGLTLGGHRGFGGGGYSTFSWTGCK
jgi:hypothetical protein